MEKLKKLTSLIIMLAATLVAFNCDTLRAESSVDVNSISATSLVFNGPMVANFDNGGGLNLWGGTTGIFNSVGATASISYSSSVAYGGSGYSLAITYGVPLAGVYSGAYTNLSSIGIADIRAYKYLSFYVRAAAPEKTFKLELQDSNGVNASLYVSDYLDGGITTTWQEVRIPLDAFVNLDSLANVSKIVFVFEHDYYERNAMPFSGTVYLDNISFGTDALSAVRIEHFADKWDMNALGGNLGDMFGGRNAYHSHDFSSTVYRDHAYALLSSYNATSGWCGMYMLFGNAYGKAHDFSYYKKFTLWMRSMSDVTTPANVKIELVDATGIHVAMIPGNTTTPTEPISTTWRKYTIYFTAFAGLSPASIKQMNIVYEDSKVGVNTVGAVYYDVIQFEE